MFVSLRLPCAANKSAPSVGLTLFSKSFFNRTIFPDLAAYENAVFPSLSTSFKDIPFVEKYSAAFKSLSDAMAKSKRFAPLAYFFVGLSPALKKASYIAASD
ncbi:hypothetical protein D3C80_1296670 [compost metagenome]